MSDILVEAVIIVALIIFNGIFAMSEIAIVSSRKARLQQMANEGNANARAALDLAKEPGNFLSTVQIGITLVGILAGAFGGATVAESITPLISAVPQKDSIEQCRTDRHHSGFADAAAVDRNDASG
jgi:putative hemolysin